MFLCNLSGSTDPAVARKAWLKPPPSNRSSFLIDALTSS